MWHIFYIQTDQSYKNKLNWYRLVPANKHDANGHSKRNGELKCKPSFNSGLFKISTSLWKPS